MALSNSKRKDSVILWDHVWMQGLFKEPIQELEIEPDLEVGQPSRQAVPQMFRLWMLTLLWFPCFMALWCSHLPEFLQEPFKLWIWKMSQKDCYKRWVKRLCGVVKVSPCQEIVQLSDKYGRWIRLYLSTSSFTALLICFSFRKKRKTT